MTILVHDCPHCRATHVALKVMAHSFVSNIAEALYLTCPICRLPSAAKLVIPRRTSQTLNQIEGDPTEQGWVLTEFWPEAPAPIIPDHVPEPVARAMLQAERNFAVAGNEDAAAMMYRRAMETALRTTFPDVHGSLYQRIEALAASHDLPGALKDWAHEVRLVGNDAAHEEDGVSRDDVTAIRALTDTLLRYVFTLPEQIRLRRAAREPATQ